jgi:predicted deacylase
VKEKADFFLDLHTGGDRFRQHPFILYSLNGAVPEERYDDLARGFGIPTLWRDTQRIFPESATAVFSAAGIPAFLVEVGGGQPLDPADIRLQADSVRNFLRKVGVLQGSPLGTIVDAFGDTVETLRAPEGSDIVLGVCTYPAAPTGGWLVELGSGLREIPAR